MRYTEVEVGKQYITGDSYGYYLVTVTKGPHNHPDYSFTVIEVEDCKTKLKDLIGGINPYEPYIESYDEWIERYPPESRQAMKDMLNEDN